MKIGIITLSASDNCGSLLQTYALQRVLKDKYKHEVEIIDFRSQKSEELYSIFPKRPWVDKRVFLNALLNYSKIAKQKREYEKFRQDLFNLTNRRYASSSELEQVDGEYDVVITGSDQVWNVNMFDHDEAFFLGWSKKAHNVSYAASFGGHNFSEAGKDAKIKNELKKFKKISVREETGVSYINQFCDRTDVELCLDPTLLVDSSDWIALSGDSCVRGDYIFYYSWAYNNDYINKLVESFAKEKGLKVYVINASKWVRYKPAQYGFELCNEMGPMAFLKLMKHAKYALVQSFHGVIFAYQMRKDFWFLDDVPENDMDSRLEQLLRLLHAKDRVLRSDQDIKKHCNDCYDYSCDLSELEMMKEKSFNFLNDI